MHPSDPVSRRGDASIRPLQTVQISPSYSPRFGPHVIANGAMSGPWPQIDKQTDAPSLNSYLDSLGFSSVVSHHVAALLTSQAGVNNENKTSHQSIFYPHHCISKTTINYIASRKSSENLSKFCHLHCAPSLERTGQHGVCHSLYLYPAVYLKRCGQTVENPSWAKDTVRSLFLFSIQASRSYGHAL